MNWRVFVVFVAVPLLFVFGFMVPQIRVFRRQRRRHRDELKRLFP